MKVQELFLQCFCNAFVLLYFKYIKGIEMKYLLSLFLVFNLFFLAACSEDEAKESIDKKPVIVSVVELQYDYNKDGLSLNELEIQSVNQYTEFEKYLAVRTENKDAYFSILEWYISDLLDAMSAIDTLPSYAPRGESKSLLLENSSGTIDYSEFVLHGDVNFDGEVDFEDIDLFKEALYQELTATEYDVNKDGVLDLKDMIKLLSLLKTEVSYFDFYTEAGVKLDIATRSFYDGRSFSYEGSEKKFLLVPKDVNHVSGFTQGLSDIEKAWYKVETFSSRLRRVDVDNTLTPAQEVKKILDEIIDDQAVQDNPHLLGWKVSLKYNENANFPELGDEALNYLESDIMLKQTLIDQHFQKTTMKKVTKRFLDGRNYLYHIGDGRYEKDDNGDYRMNLKADEFDVLVIAKRESVKRSITSLGGKPVVTTLLIHGSSVIFTSDETKTYKGSVKYKDASANGKLLVSRIGPSPTEVDYSTDIEFGSFRFEANIPFGAYKIEYENSCSCAFPIESEHIFDINYQEDQFNVPAHESLAEVTLEILDSDDEPIEDIKVELRSKSCVDEENQQLYLGTTNDSGDVNFLDVNIGNYEVYINDRMNTDIHFCENHAQTLYDAEAFIWDINITFNGRFTQYEKSYKNIKIARADETLKDETAWLLGLFPFPYADEYPEGVVLSETSYFSDTYGENRISFYPNGYNSGFIQTGYCFFTDELNELLLDEGDSGIGCWAESYTPTWDQIDTSFNSTQEASFLLHESFSISDTGRWINDAGESTIRIDFSPVF